MNAIYPGVVSTRALGDSGADDPAEVMMRGTPVGTVGRAQDIALAAVYLAGDEARFVHGAVIDVDGGRIGAAVIAA